MLVNVLFLSSFALSSFCIPNLKVTIFRIRVFGIVVPFHPGLLQSFSLSIRIHIIMKNEIEDELMGRLKRGHFILRIANFLSVKKSQFSRLVDAISWLAFCRRCRAINNASIMTKLRILLSCAQNALKSIYQSAENITPFAVYNSWKPAVPFSQYLPFFFAHFVCSIWLSLISQCRRMCVRLYLL